MVRPMSLLSDPTVLRKLEVSWVLADSPRTRERGPKATRELHENTFGQLHAVEGRLPLRRNLRSLTVGDLVDEDVDTTVTGSSDL